MAYGTIYTLDKDDRAISFRPKRTKVEVICTGLTLGYPYRAIYDISLEEARKWWKAAKRKGYRA